MLCRVIPASSAYLELWEKRLEYAHILNNTTALTTYAHADANS